VHLQPFIAERLGFVKGDFPVTESVCERTIALPFYNNIAKEQIAKVCEVLKEALDSQVK
jgi:perosamine synthetase